jgi:hypothetical protein
LISQKQFSSLTISDISVGNCLLSLLLSFGGEGEKTDVERQRLEVVDYLWGLEMKEKFDRQQASKNGKERVDSRFTCLGWISAKVGKHKHVLELRLKQRLSPSQWFFGSFPTSEVKEVNRT